MKKFYHKKSISQEETPILIRAERRKTLMELAKEVKSDEWHEMAVRAVSSSSSRQTGNSNLGSNSSTNSAFVITDSDLASSWIYTSRKEASNEVFEPNHSPGYVQEHNFNSTYRIAPHRRRCCKACRKFTVVTIIALCILGIISTIGGIVFLEVFSRNDSSMYPFFEGKGALKTSRFNTGSPSNYSPAPPHNDSMNAPEKHSNPSKAITKLHSTVSPFLRRGKSLIRDEDTTYINSPSIFTNGTINKIKNVLQKLTDTSEHISENMSRISRGNFASDTGQTLFGKLASFLLDTIGSGKSAILDEFGKKEGNVDQDVRKDDFPDESNQQQQSLLPDKDSHEGFGSGEIVMDRKDLGKKILDEVVTHPQDFSREPLLVDLENNDLRGTGLHGISSNARLHDWRFKLPRTIHEAQVDVTPSVPGLVENQFGKRIAENIHRNSNDSKNISNSIAKLFQIFRTIGKMTSTSAPTTVDVPQRSTFHQRLSNINNNLFRSINSEERNQYLERLRNLTFNVDVVR